MLGKVKGAQECDATMADIIAVTGDPVKDVKVFATVDFVMKEGKIYKQ